MRNNINNYLLSDADFKDLKYKPSQRNEVNTEFIYYICPKPKVNALKKVNNLACVFPESNLTLRNEDLFKEYNDYYFLSALKLILKFFNR